MAVAEWGRRRDVRAAPISRPIPLYTKASFLITPAEFREKNRLPAVYAIVGYDTIITTQVFSLATQVIHNLLIVRSHNRTIPVKENKYNTK